MTDTVVVTDVHRLALPFTGAVTVPLLVVALVVLTGAGLAVWLVRQRHRRSLP